MSAPLHASMAPSDWVRRWTHLIPRLDGPCRVLDLACGHGRHSRWLAQQGLTVLALDRDADALQHLHDLAPQVTTQVADLEGSPWPLPGQQFDAVLVTHYLWRPLWPHLLASLAPGGVLIYETFAHGNASVGKPSRPDFLLQPGELLRACAALRVVAYEDGFLEPPPRYLQRLVAVNLVCPPAADAPPPRYALRAAG
jgi:SAM-dependent methyltransferase